MEAGALKCPMCGASVTADSPNCSHCGSRLAAVACPSCFAMVFEGSKFCPHCGAMLSRSPEQATVRACPRCDTAKLARVQLGETPVDECSSCHGLWIEAGVFERICADKERQAAVLGAGSALPDPAGSLEMTVRYLRCPACRKLMNRVNFAKCSGVIVDVCRGHGTWFDRNELQSIVEFIRSGGLDLAREKEKRDLEVARRRLEAARAAAGQPVRPHDHWDCPLGTFSSSAELGQFFSEVGSSVFDHLFHHD